MLQHPDLGGVGLKARERVAQIAGNVGGVVHHAGDLIHTGDIFGEDDGQLLCHLCVGLRRLVFDLGAAGAEHEKTEHDERDDDRGEKDAQKRCAFLTKSGNWVFLSGKMLFFTVNLHETSQKT